MEDALKRLGNLTQEEARVAIAQNLKATHAVDDRGRVVIERVLDVDGRVVSVGDEVKAVKDKISVVIDGAQLVLRPSPKFNSSSCPGRKRGKGSLQQTVNNVDQVEYL